MQLALILTIVLACVLSLQAPAEVPGRVGHPAVADGHLGIRRGDSGGHRHAPGRCVTLSTAEIKADGGRAAHWYRSGRWLHLSVHVTYVVAAYAVLDYASIVKSQAYLGRLLLIDDLITLAPVILPLLLSWAVFAGIERPGMHRLPWRSRLQIRVRFTVLQVRHYLLLPLTPILVLFAAHDVLQLVHPANVERVEAPALCACLLGTSLGLPWLLRLIWPTRPLAVGVERQQVEDLLQQAGLKVTDILVWQTENQIVNAATAGVLPGCRYLLLSDALIGRLKDGQLTAIAAHEAGHLQHRHAIQLLLSLAIPLLASLVQQQLLAWAGVSAAVGVCGAVFVLVFWLLIHCRIARLLEHQADVAACHLISRSSCLEPEAVDRYGEALQAVACGGSAADWLHPSIGARIALLRYLLLQDNRELDFQRHVRYVNRLLTALALLLLGCWAFWL